MVSTGRSDFPNQVNNSLAFPGIFRGVLDVGATAISDEMALAAADVLARFAEQRGLEHGLLPTMADWDVVPEVAVATATAAQRQGLAPPDRSADELREAARARIAATRETMKVLIDHGIIPGAPPATR